MFASSSFRCVSCTASTINLCFRIMVVMGAHLGFFLLSRLPFIFRDATLTPCFLPKLFHKVARSALSLVSLISSGVRFLFRFEFGLLDPSSDVEPGLAMCDGVCVSLRIGASRRTEEDPPGSSVASLSASGH